jgi:citrate lyase subunit beta/citryl-CoA lyase
VVVVDGRLIEQLHVDNAQRIVALADAIAAREAIADQG